MSRSFGVAACFVSLFQVPVCSWEISLLFLFGGIIIADFLVFFFFCKRIRSRSRKPSVFSLGDFVKLKMPATVEIHTSKKAEAEEEETARRQESGAV